MTNLASKNLFVKLSDSFNYIQNYLFPLLKEAIGPLNSKQKEFISLCDTINLDIYLLNQFSFSRTGRPKSSRISILRAFLVKAINDLPTTKSLWHLLHNSPQWRILCGWEEEYQIPSESTFSRAFAELAASRLPEKIHETMIKKTLGDTQAITGNNNIDSTEIMGREKSSVQYKPGPKKPKIKKKRGRKTAEEKRNSPPPEPKRIELQKHRTLNENLADLPLKCDWGCKRNSKGRTERWCGYKLHISATDAGVPTSVILTSASVHDSQVAIPLMQINQNRLFCSLYDVMDSAYDAKEIKNFSEMIGHVPIIDPNPRRLKNVTPLDPAKKKHYNIRSTVERTNSELKDNYGGRHIRVKGPAKVLCHLMFGIIAITSKHLLGMLSV